MIDFIGRLASLDSFRAMDETQKVIFSGLFLQSNDIYSETLIKQISAIKKIIKQYDQKASVWLDTDSAVLDVEKDRLPTEKYHEKFAVIRISRYGAIFDVGLYVTGGFISSMNFNFKQQSGREKTIKLIEAKLRKS